MISVVAILPVLPFDHADRATLGRHGRPRRPEPKESGTETVDEKTQPHSQTTPKSRLVHSLLRCLRQTFVSLCLRFCDLRWCDGICVYLCDLWAAAMTRWLCAFVPWCLRGGDVRCYSGRLATTARSFRLNRCSKSTVIPSRAWTGISSIWSNLTIA